MLKKVNKRCFMGVRSRKISDFWACMPLVIPMPLEATALTLSLLSSRRAWREQLKGGGHPGGILARDRSSDSSRGFEGGKELDIGGEVMMEEV